MKLSTLNKYVAVFSAPFILLGASNLYAATTDYKAEPDTKQLQPHTTDEYSNRPKAEGAQDPNNRPNADERGNANNATSGKGNSQSGKDAPERAQERRDALEGADHNDKAAQRDAHKDREKCNQKDMRARNECLAELEKKRQ